MGDIAEILRKKNFSEPPELAAIKSYIQEKFGVEVGLAIRDDSIIITSRSGSLANTLRLHSQQITKACNVTKKLIFKIG